MRSRYLWLCSLTLPLAGACSLPAIQQATSDLLTTQKITLALPRVDGDPQVSPAARRDILKLKDSIAHLANAYMDCQPPDANPQRIQEALSTLIPAIRADDNRYGSALSFEAAITDRLVSITATFGVNCGLDTMLLIYAPSKSSWAEVLRYQSPPYDDVSGAFWSFKHKISPPDANGAWFVITSRVMPWCSSTWSSIEYAILRPGPKVLLKKSESMWWGNEDFGTLAATPTTAEIRYTDRSIDMAVHNRPHIRRYEISGDSVKRVPPVAESPRDFVDEWIVSPWSEARDWSAPGLQSFHAQAKKSASEFVSIQNCPGQPDTVQVGVTDIKTEETHLYFRVTGTTTFKMLSVRTTQDPSCSGPNTWNPGQDVR
jgi:hypothetical protein